MEVGNKYERKRSNVRWYFAIGFFFIGVIAYMDRSNISYIGTDDERFGVN